MKVVDVEAAGPQPGTPGSGESISPRPARDQGMVRRRTDLQDILPYCILDPVPKALDQGVAGGKKVVAGLRPAPQGLAQIFTCGGVLLLQGHAQVSVESVHLAIPVRGFQVKDLN